MSNPIQYYDWGSTTAIPGLLGRDDLRGTHCAELWMGAHPKAPSRLHLDGGERSLLDALSKDPVSFLGAGVAEQFGETLPFLFKILAAEQALSIQAHPSKGQAEAGFQREDAEGIPGDAFHRNYRDRNHKPELICALGEFWALRGFRSIAEICEELRPYGPIRSAVADLEEQSDSEGLRRFFETLMTLREEQRDALVDEAVEALSRSEAPHHRWVRTLYEQYGRDIGVLAPLYLNCIRLEAGQGLFLPARTLHAYLSGVGVEIMANSDNVLRGGLTRKHIDVPELLNALEFREDPPRILEAVPLDAGAVSGDGLGEAVMCLEEFETPAAEFRLRRATVTDGGTCRLPAEEGPRILLCVEGRVRIRAAGETEGGGEMALGRGASLYALPGDNDLLLSGEGTLYVAGVAAPGREPGAGSQRGDRSQRPRTSRGRSGSAGS